MNIEIFNPKDEVKEWLINYTSDKLMELHRQDAAISRALVYFKEEPDSPGEDKICEIELTIYGDSLFIHSKACSFEKAVRDAIQELSLRVDQQLKKHNEPPAELTSTVNV